MHASGQLSPKTFVGEEVDVGLGGRLSEFFYALLVEADQHAQSEMTGGGLRSRNPNRRKSRWH
jgi:hypothetical protein